MSLARASIFAHRLNETGVDRRKVISLAWQEGGYALLTELAKALHMLPDPTLTSYRATGAWRLAQEAGLGPQVVRKFIGSSHDKRHRRAQKYGLTVKEIPWR